MVYSGFISGYFTEKKKKKKETEHNEIEEETIACELYCMIDDT